MKSLILVFAGTILLCATSGARRPPLEQAPAREADRKNPFAGQESAQRAGHKLFERECASCHGAEAAGTRRAPSLSSTRLRAAAPGAIFWVLRNGSLRYGMPSFAHLPDQQRWQLVTYLTSR